MFEEEKPETKIYFFKSLSIKEALLLEELFEKIQSGEEEVSQFERNAHKIIITTEKQEIIIPKRIEE